MFVDIPIQPCAQQVLVPEGVRASERCSPVIRRRPRAGADYWSGMMKHRHAAALIIFALLQVPTGDRLSAQAAHAQ